MRILFDIPDMGASRNWGILVGLGRLIDALSDLPCDVALVPGGMVDCCDVGVGKAFLGNATWGRIQRLPRSCDGTPDLICRVSSGHEQFQDQPQLPTCNFVYNNPFPVKYYRPIGRLCVFPLNGSVDSNYYPMNDRVACRSFLNVPTDATVALKLVSAAPMAEQNLVPLLDAVVELFRLGHAITLVVKSVPIPESRLREFQDTVKTGLTRGLLSKKWWTKYTNKNLLVFLEEILHISDMRKLYNASDFLVDTEGPLSSGVCVAEATACGIPSIIPATTVAHSQNPFVKRVPTLVPDGATGTRIVLASAELAESILCMLDDSVLRCRAKAQGNEHAAVNFSPRLAADNLAGVSRLAQELYF